MGDSAMTVVAIMVAVVIMGVFPLMAMANEKDKTAELAAQTATTEFVNNIRTTGKLTSNDYDNYVSTLAATGNSYNTELTLQVLDENPAKKTTTGTTIGDNVYYTKYTTQIVEELGSSGKITLKEGDIVSVKAENTNITIAQQLRNFMYKVTGNSSSTIAAEASGMVTTAGTTYNN
ncbi:MAG: hypothetical protein HFJ17_03460 [Clostridia bacterium]|nr:hypothetical protein [Clostridia bacterium]